MNTDVELLLRVVRDAEAFKENPESESLATDADWRAAGEPDGALLRIAETLQTDTLTEEDYPAVCEIAGVFLLALQRQCDRRILRMEGKR